MKKLIALLMSVAAGVAYAQVDLSALNDTQQASSFKIRSVTLGSGTPSLAQLNDNQFDNARSLGNGMYQVPGFMPYYPTAATIFPRIVQVRCSAEGCDGYSVTPAIGRGEYIYVQPVMVPVAVTKPTPKAEDITIGADALFDFDTASLKPAGKDKLDQLVSKLKGVTYSNITITGYTDQIGTDRYNERLSLRRAQAVRAYVVNNGLNGSKITALGKGFTNPLAKGCPVGRKQPAIDCMAPNRRVEIQVAGLK